MHLSKVGIGPKWHCCSVSRRDSLLDNDGLLISELVKEFQCLDVIDDSMASFMELHTETN